MTHVDSPIVYFRPCVTEAGKTSAEAHLTLGKRSSGSALEFFNSQRLCWALTGSPVFSRVKCSDKLGIAKIDIDKKSIVVSKGGRVNVRRADSKEDALRIIQLVARATWPAMICSRCHRAVLECVIGYCGRCADGDCPLLLCGPPEPGPTSTREGDTRTVGEILRDLAATESPSLQEARRHFDEAFQVLSRVMEAHSPHDLRSGFERPLAEKLSAGKQLAQKLMAQSQTQAESSAGLALLGIAFILESLRDLALEYCELAQSNNELPPMGEVWRIAVSGYEALWRNDKTAMMRVTELCAKLKRGLNADRRKRQIDGLRDSSERVTKLGFYMARMASTRLAV
jgi:hypothetical protein